MELKFVGRLAKSALGGLSQESVRSQWINLALTIVLVGGLSYPGRAAAGAGPQVQLAASQSPLDFGNVSTGTNKTKTITLTNSGSASVRLSRAHVSGSSFKVSGLSLPLTLGPKQNTTFNVVFAPGRTGNISGSVSLVSNDARYATTIVLSGTGVQRHLVVNPTSTSFGNVGLGTHSAHTITLTNPGPASVTVYRAYASGSGFSMTGLRFPLKLGSGQKTTFSVAFAPVSMGSVTGGVSLVSNAVHSPTTIALTGTGVQPLQSQLSVIPPSASFGNVGVGARNTYAFTMTNSGRASVTVSQVHVSGSGLSVGGLSLPLTLAPGQKTTFSVVFAPASPGNVTGSVSLVSNAPNSPTTIALSGTGVQPLQPQISVTPPSASFGNVGVGTRNAYAFTLTNSGSASVTVSQANVSGSGLSVGGLSLPLTLTPGQKTTFSVVFAPASTGNITGSVSLVSNALNSPTTIALSGTAVQPQLSVVPPSASFGNVGVGTRNTYAFTLTNSGSASVTVSQANVSGSGLSVTGLSLPLTLTPGQKTTFSVVFAPASTGNITGSVSLVSNAPNSPTMIAMTGTAVQPQLSVVPPSASFGDVAVGTRNSQTITLINSGTGNLTISQATPSGNGFSMTGLTVPLTLSAGQRTSFNVAFAPTSAGSITGSLSLVSDAPNSPSTIALSGTGVTSTFLLTASPTSLSFGNVTVGSTSAPQTVTLTNSGNSSVSISQINVSGSGFSASGLTAPLTLAAGQTASFSVVFASTTAGAAIGNVSLVSNATNSPTIALSASGVQPIPLARTLSWNPSPSAAVSYNVYRGTQSGGSYQKLNSSPVTTTTYTDNSVLAGQTYFYVVTAVDSRNMESVHSNEVSATIPSQ